MKYSEKLARDILGDGTLVLQSLYDDMVSGIEDAMKKQAKACAYAYCIEACGPRGAEECIENGPPPSCETHKLILNANTDGE